MVIREKKLLDIIQELKIKNKLLKKELTKNNRDDLKNIDV